MSRGRNSSRCQFGRISSVERNFANDRSNYNDNTFRKCQEDLRLGDIAHKNGDFRMEAYHHRAVQESLKRHELFKTNVDAREAYAWNSLYEHHSYMLYDFASRGKFFQDVVYYDGSRYSLTPSAYQYAKSHGIQIHEDGRLSIVSDISLGKSPYNPYCYTNASGNVVHSTHKPIGNAVRSLARDNSHVHSYSYEGKQIHTNSHGYEVAGQLTDLQQTYKLPPKETSEGYKINSQGFYDHPVIGTVHYQTHQPYNPHLPNNQQGYAIKPTDIVTYPIDYGMAQEFENTRLKLVAKVNQLLATFN